MKMNSIHRKKKWIGECYSTVAILYVCLSELGYKCKLCLDEVTLIFLQLRFLIMFG